MAAKTKKTSEPSSMEELLAMHDAHIKTFKYLDVIDAEFLEMGERSATFKVGGKTQGECRDDSFIEAKAYIKKLKPGDMVRALVLDPETPDGHVLLSLRHAAKEDFWKRIEKYYKEDKIIDVVGQSASNHGLMVSYESETAFIPASQFTKEKAKNLDELVGERIKTKIIDVDVRNERIVLSERAVSEADDIARNKKALATFKKGEKYAGTISTVVSFGAFVEIPVELKDEDEPVVVEGLVHVSELSWSKVDDPDSVIEEGQKVDVVVLGVDRNKLALSMRQAQEDPWESIAKKYKPDDKLKGTIVRISDFGAFVELEPGIEGLIHMTKIAPGTALKEGQEVNVYIEEIDMSAKKIALGMVVTTSKPIGYR